MRSRIPTVMLPAEAQEFREEIRRILAELGRGLGDAPAGECSPPLDVYETEGAVEIRMDLPGTGSTMVRLVVKGAALLIVGEKSPRRARGDSSFHLVERDFGRFVRTVQLPAACDAGKASASLRDGELRVTLPKIADRRGRPIQIAIG